MTRDETVALFLQGREAWNAWADEMLAARKTLEEAGKWEEKRDDFGVLQGKNDETCVWIDGAKADFYHCHFLVTGGEETKEIAGEQPKENNIADQPLKLVVLDDALLDFSGFKFPGVASFTCTTFSGIVSFANATFLGDVWFISATFSGATRFANTAFAGVAMFPNAIFQSYTSFEGAKFLEEVWFTGITAERALVMTNAEFSFVPAFNQSDFKQAPDLDDVRFPLPDFWRRGDDKLIAKYRALRRMAIQGADYEREQMAFKGELRSKRWTVDKFSHPGLWLGLFYDAIADCGRSIVRPASTWVVSIFVFAAFYWWWAAGQAADKCSAADSPVLQALYLSVKNALVVFGGTRDARVNQAYVCLYDGAAELPKIPASVTFMETLVQLPMSAALIFLFLLAVKNRYKIK